MEKYPILIYHVIQILLLLLGGFFMNIELENSYRSKLKKLLNKYLLKSRQFCDKYCHPDGLVDIHRFASILHEVPEEILYSNKLSYDFDYFAFTKSTKTLHAIRELLNDQTYHFNEDILILTRSIFESHLSSRYFREHIDNSKTRNEVIREFIRSPIGLITNHYFPERSIVKDKKGNKIGEIKSPSKMKEGEDKKYYHSFYPFLCQFTHSSFGIFKSYFKGSYFCYDKDEFQLETLLFVTFCFTKLFEGIATVWGENYDTLEEEKSYYDLVYDCLELQQEIFKYLIDKYDNSLCDNTDWIIQLYLYEGNPQGRNEKIKDMLVKMETSLYEEIGSLKKDKIDESGKFIREYPNYD